MASLALIFAIQSFKPSPFFVMDEVDSALDKENVEKITKYIEKNSEHCQFLVISLKEKFFCKADGLIGVYKDNDEGCSGILSLDLRQMETQD